MFGSRNSGKDNDERGGRPASTFIDEPWFADLQKLNNDELMRMYTMISDRHYRFAKNAWYIPIGGDQRCPIMVAKGYRSPDTLDRMAEFEDTAKTLEGEFRHFIDAWDFGYITERDIEKAILKILESRNIEITEHSSY
ncbi:hypothetical protein Ngar_c07550 [Candidatus Nitrososphaera gargensis Ga9.2]|uniref:Uncharacterized protein n=1 Tax=Nitrososphaera gargensis (strain Ga9.2) TaxID=1237085 RepID=K0IFW0_NITGG|nr:hypothetical protein [Candidatus Nitrososphaera gargensis]AFU57698.1 hypothetical protein Ngar_c07550 [Candidatus Nitrososphaera gargensis Ga9.2]